MARFRSRPPALLYVAGPFAMGYTEFYNFVIPLYGLSLGMSAGQIGMLVGARSLLAVFLSIHVGVLMDRLGTRRVLSGRRWAWRRSSRCFRGSGPYCCRSSMAARCSLPGRVHRP